MTKELHQKRTGKSQNCKDKKNKNLAKQKSGNVLISRGGLFSCNHDIHRRIDEGARHACKQHQDRVKKRIPAVISDAYRFQQNDIYQKIRQAKRALIRHRDQRLAHQRIGPVQV